MKVGVAFSGGGIRGAAHLGIMQALHENGVVPSIYTGTSSGSIAAVLLALGYTPIEAFEKFKKVRSIIDIAYFHILKGLFTPSKIKGIAKGKKLHRVLDDVFDGRQFSHVCEQDVKLGVIATRILTGEQTIFANSEILDPSKINDDHFLWYPLFEKNLSGFVRASCSIPGIYLPYEVNKEEYVDGGITNNLPSDIAYALGAEKVIAIDLGYSGKTREVGGIMEILSQSIYVMVESIIDDHDYQSGIYLNPEIYDIGSLEISKTNECYIRGYEYAMANMKEILEKLGD
ncbi:patatin-like phospholipase family protein [Falsibacillus pallidus]|uniref:patatin-like phospholipase family protein n=1 Tax=Falsibacillus pallidus TaxID=493781 RepID=UPI003D98CFD0